jgi:hypothetical protein
MNFEKYRRAFKALQEDKFVKYSTHISCALMILEALKLFLNFTLDFVLYIVFFGILLKLIWTIITYESKADIQSDFGTIHNN